MTARDAPAWLAALQARFGAVIRTPLDRETGILTATPAAYDPDLVADIVQSERLAVYNRQYWFRLFSVFHQAFPLTTRLVGHWALNDYAARFLLASPPGGWDIARAIDGFDDFFAREVSEQPALVEAVRIDAAWTRVFNAAPTTPFRPGPSDAERLLDLQLEPSPAMAVVEQDWPLLELRQTLRDDPGETAVPLPPKLPQREYWAIVRAGGGIAQFPLEAREAELFSLLRQHPVREALARLEAACPENERNELPARTRAWLARSVKFEFWRAPISR